MSNEPTHGPNFNENDYARPNQSWVCGWAADGHACPLGPTRRGICRSAFECAPYQQGDTWNCARMKAAGGPCEHGPLPDGTCCRPIQRCQPVRSIMSRRGVVSLCVFAAALGTALIMVAVPNRSRLLSPGPLISAHHQVVDRCDACHVDGDATFGVWVENAADKNVGKQQSQLCLKCHLEMGDDALHAHSQSIDTLAALTDQQTERTSGPQALLVAAAQQTFGGPAGAHAELACATCHREHHGARDLTAMTNQQCQVCHTSDFHSFASGHPELVGYPYTRQTRIYFDHQTHYGKHFASTSGQLRECRDCHRPDAAGRYMLSKSFAETCAQCHSQQIEDSSLPGVRIAALPAIDVERLNEAGIEIGQWPRIYPAHVEASTRLTPLLALISPQRQALRTAQQNLTGVNLADLRGATDEQLGQVEALVWVFKESLFDILADGRTGLQADFAANLNDRLDNEQITELVAVVPLEGLAAMQREWLPQLEAEIAARRAGTPLPIADAEDAVVVPAAVDVVAQDQRNSRLLRSGWYLDSPSLSLRYRPTRHADAMMKTLFDLSVPNRALTANRDAAAPVDPSEVRLSELFDTIASPFSSGRCRKCHTVEWEAEVASMNWLAYQPPMSQHHFTRFNHAPHLTRQNNAACLSCHEFAADNQEGRILRPTFVANPWNGQPAGDFSSDFADMSRSNCAQCHSRPSDRDRCTTCHNYHVR